jgi:hypothetical protein
MKHLVIGAGATLGEALALGNARENCPPLMGDFARKTWANYTPYPVLERYLNELGLTDLGDDPRELFYELEESGATNIERFMEYCWQNRHVTFPEPSDEVRPPGFISGLRISIAGATKAPVSAGEEFWENLLYHGIGSPIQFLTIQCFFENGVGWKDLALSKTIGRSLSQGDLVLNLNYDTVFELALEQLGQPFSYAPNVAQTGEVVVCKPHGSLNMVSNSNSFAFGQPSWLGMPQPSGYRSYSGLIPPRLNKQYNQHPVSALIIQSVQSRMPSDLIFWGIGLTDSDVDLVELYKAWSKNKPSLTVINPDVAVAEKVENILGLPVQHFSDLSSWEAGCGRL